MASTEYIDSLVEQIRNQEGDYLVALDILSDIAKGDAVWGA